MVTLPRHPTTYNGGGVDPALILVEKNDASQKRWENNKKGSSPWFIQFWLLEEEPLHEWGSLLHYGWVRTESAY